jgi:hypothetical protein
MHPYVATVTVGFADATRLVVRAIADALMDVPAVATARVSPDGGSAIYRVDVEADAVESAAAAAVAPASKVTDALGIDHRILTVDVEEEAEEVPYTHRSVVFRSRPGRWRDWA